MKFINSNIVDIDIDYNQAIDELIIQNCPKLNSISANGCKLKKLVIEECPKLTNISAYGNKLDKLELKDFLELRKVYLPFNFIKELEIKDCPKLEILQCNNNHLKNLKVNHLTNLKSLHCYRNWDLTRLNCNDLVNLENILAQECNLNFAGILHCVNLEVLDLAENKLSNLNVTKCKELRWFSCRDNFLTRLILKNNQFLEFLSISNNYFSPMDVKNLSHLTNLETLIIGLHLPSDASEEERKLMGFAKGGYNKWFGSLEAFKDMKFLTNLYINNTDIDEGLEYLPKGVKIFCCYPNTKEAKVKKIFDQWKQMKEDEGYGSSESTRPTSPEPTEPQELEQDKPSYFGWL